MKIVLESNFTTHQKIHTLSISGIILIFIVQLLRGSLNFIGYGILSIFIILFISSIIFAFSKKGLVIKENKLFKANFFANSLIFKKAINLDNKTAIAILKFRSTQKMAFFSAARPDLTSEFNSFELNLLNEKHTIKDPVFRLKNEENSNKALNFITNNLNIKYEAYSPDFD